MIQDKLKRVWLTGDRDVFYRISVLFLSVFPSCAHCCGIPCVLHRSMREHGHYWHLSVQKKFLSPS